MISSEWIHLMQLNLAISLWEVYRELKSPIAVLTWGKETRNMQIMWQAYVGLLVWKDNFIPVEWKVVSSSFLLRIQYEIWHLIYFFKKEKKFSVTFDFMECLVEEIIVLLSNSTKHWILGFCKEDMMLLESCRNLSRRCQRTDCFTLAKVGLLGLQKLQVFQEW